MSSNGTTQNLLWNEWTRVAEVAEISRVCRVASSSKSRARCSKHFRSVIVVDLQGGQNDDPTLICVERTLNLHHLGSHSYPTTLFAHH